MTTNKTKNKDATAISQIQWPVCLCQLLRPWSMVECPRLLQSLSQTANGDSVASKSPGNSSMNTASLQHSHCMIPLTTRQSHPATQLSSDLKLCKVGFLQTISSSNTAVI